MYNFCITGFGLIVVPITARVVCGNAIPSKLAGEILKEKQQKYLDKYTLSNNTVQYFRKMYQKSSEDYIFDQSETKKFVDMYNQNNNSINENKSFHDILRKVLFIVNFFSDKNFYDYKKTMFDLKSNKILSRDLYKANFYRYSPTSVANNK